MDQAGHITLARGIFENLLMKLISGLFQFTIAIIFNIYITGALF